MSDQCCSHETWLAKLSDHLDKERYAAATARWCVAVARQFLRSLDKRQVEVGAAKPARRAVSAARTAEVSSPARPFT
jgi:hypothetical protein